MRPEGSVPASVVAAPVLSVAVSWCWWSAVAASASASASAAHEALPDRQARIAAAFEQDPRLAEAIVAFAEEYRVEARGRILGSPELAALLDGAPPPPPVDWSGCGVVEWMAGPAHDTWVLRGTPTLAYLLIGHHDHGWRWRTSPSSTGGTRP